MVSPKRQRSRSSGAAAAKAQDPETTTRVPPSSGPALGLAAPTTAAGTYLVRGGVKGRAGAEVRAGVRGGVKGRAGAGVWVWVWG